MSEGGKIVMIVSEGGKIVMILLVMGGVASLKIVGFADRCQKCSWDNVRRHLTSSSYITG